MNAGSAKEAKLQTATSSGAEYSIISVHKLEDLMVPKFCWLDFAKGGEVSIEPIEIPDKSPTIRSVLVEHKGTSGLDLGVQDSEPKLLCLDDLSELAFPFVLFVKIVESLAMHIGQTGALVRAHQCPVSVGFNTSHEHVGDPKSVEQVSSSDFFFTVVLSQIDKVEDVCVPRLQIDAVNRLDMSTDAKSRS